VRIASKSRWFVVTVFAVGAFASRAPGQLASPPTITGVYNGSYAGDQGPVKFKLSITQQSNGTLTGVFTLYPTGSAGTTSYTCDIRGRYLQVNRQFQLRGSKWEPVSPANLGMMGMNGTFDPDGGQGAGQISGKMLGRPGPDFEAIRDAAESANMASVTATAPPRPVIAQQGSQPTAAKPAAPKPPSSSAPGTYIARTAIDGVYIGTYGSNPDDEVPAKLYVKFINNGSVDGILDGLFTFDVTPSPEGKPVTYTYKLTGVYATGTMGWSAKPLGKPAPDAYAVSQIYAEFDKTPYVKGRNGQLEFDFIPDQISGKVIDRNNRAINKFKGTRDKAESANLDSLLATQTSAAGPVVNTAASPAAPAGRIGRPGIPGVFNGTYTRANESPIKFKLTITRPTVLVNGTYKLQDANGLAGVATIYLPTDSGTKAYTYSLKGALDGSGAFHLFVHDWETTPPKDFKDFKAMGFNGTLRANENQHTARILSAQASGSLADMFVPNFEATWDATESADIRGTIAAQEARSADEVAALKAREETLKNAPPKQLASKDLVRKSRLYWDGYQTDMIREVFDGGFGAAIDENEQFQRVFLTYVGTLSAQHPECLPPDHQTVTVTEITSMTTTKNLYWREGVDPESDRYQTTKTEKTYTVEMDPRFVARFNQFHAALNSPGAGLRDAATAAQSGGAQGVVRERLAIVTDMQKFFADHACKSAAMRQLTENFLRAINGDPSLQQADGKIDGAQAESDKDLPPGRYARFVDGANAYFRERAQANPTKFGHSQSHDTALCQRLAELYEFHMSRDEEYYYANDFAGRFIPIMGQRASCSDPAWPQLHPDVEKAIAEIK
jgi:hypothetical protein